MATFGTLEVILFRSPKTYASSPNFFVEFSSSETLGFSQTAFALRAFISLAKKKKVAGMCVCVPCSNFVVVRWVFGLGQNKSVIPMSVIPINSSSILQKAIQNGVTYVCVAHRLLKWRQFFCLSMQ